MYKKDFSARSDRLKSDDQKYRRNGTLGDVRLDVLMDKADKKLGLTVW